MASSLFKPMASHWRTIALGIGVAVVTILGACQRAPVAQAEALAPRPAMFRLADADSEIYLFGTVHIMPKGMAWRTPAFDTAFKKAARVYFETPGDDAAQQEANALLQSSGMNPPGVRLDATLSTNERKRLRKAANKAGLDYESLQPMRPWLASIMLSLNAMIAEGQDPDSGVEKIIEAEATERDKEVRYLETIEAQLGIFPKLSPQSQKAILLATFDDIEEGAALTAKLDHAWVTGDLKTLDKYVNDDLRKLDKAVYKAILADRNQNWSREIDQIMRADQGGKTIMIAVGTGHLAGKDGVPTLLQALGYHVERVQ